MAGKSKDKQEQRKTVFKEGVGLRIPVYDAATEKFLSEPETRRYSMLELLFEPEEIESLAIVKIDKESEESDPLKGIRFDDGVKRIAAFSSGDSVYYAQKETARKLHQFFETQSESACRYGSLLASSCNEEAQLLEDTDGEPIRVKIVNFESEDPAEREEAARYATGDCHGKISPRLAKMLGGKGNRPFQFRFAWKQEWGNKGDGNPQVSFLAKGTFLPSRKLTQKEGYDLILDKSSIKGINEDKGERIPCGDYELPKAVIGNRSNAQLQNYDNSWQINMWYSQAAIEKDINPETLQEAQKLAEIQKDPLKLARHLVERYDKRQEFIDSEDSDSSPTAEDESQERSESRLISILRNDKYGQLLDHPKVADFMRSQLAKRWKDLAVNGAVGHGSAMAQPADDLKKGTIVAPYMKDGEEVIVTRYPIVSKDNIRRYTVDNKQRPDLKRYKGCAFIRSDQAMEHHQCDFDGDQLVITPTSRFPNMAKETKHANEEREFDKVQKRKKISYSEAKCGGDDPRIGQRRGKATIRPGDKKYTTLREIAAAVPKNNIGRVATAIGKVQTSQPQSGEPQKLFERRKRKMLGKLFDALQIEVDSPKSATRMDDYHPDLIESVNKWHKKYPSPIFDFKNQKQYPQVYKTAPLPTFGTNNINTIAENAVNPAWQKTRIRSRHRNEFRYLISPPQSKKAQESWQKHYVQWAEDLKQNYNERSRDIHQDFSGDPEAIREEFGKLYEDMRGDIEQSFTPEERQLAAAALWRVETTDPNLNEPRKAAAKLSRKLNTTFSLEPDFQRQGDLVAQDTYVLDVPFERYPKKDGKILKNKGQDLASKFKQALDEQGVEYEATIHSELPMVRFALTNPDEKLIHNLENKYGGNDNYHLNNSELTYRTRQKGELRNISDRIVPPASYHRWLENSEDITPKSALTLNLFTEEVCDSLQSYQFDKAELVGQRFNDYQDTDFSSPQLQSKKFSLTVTTLDDPGNQYDGTPIVQLKGKNLAMFSKESPKLPPGATFKATIEPGKGSSLKLNIDPDSVTLPEVEAPEVEEQKNETTRAKLDISYDINQRFKDNNTEAQPSRITTQKETASEALRKAIKETFSDTGNRKIKVANWTAFVNTKNGDYSVRDGNRKIISQGNLETGEVRKPLNERNTQRFNQQIKEADKTNQNALSQQPNQRKREAISL